MERVDIADRLLKEKKYSEAIDLLEEVHQAYPREESVVLMLAWAHYDGGETARAVEYLEILFQRELKRKTFTGFAFDELVRIYKQERNFAKLVEICILAVAAQPDDITLLVELGNAHLQSGNAAEACRIYEKSTQLENDNSALYCLLGEALFAVGKTAESEAAYLQAAEIDPEQTDRYYFKIAGLYARSGNYREAQRLLAKCIAARPEDPLYHCCLGDALVGLNKIDEARDEYETAVSYDRPGAGAYYNRFGNMLARNGHHSEALDIFKKALELEPDNPVYARHLTLSFKALGLIDTAK